MTTNRNYYYDPTMSRRVRQQYSILVVGKAGNGKSATCNTLLGEDKFTTGRSMTATTTAMQEGVRSDGDMVVHVVDTPDITNCGMDPSQQYTEVNNWKSRVNDSPSLVLVTVRCDVRYTTEELAIFREIKGLWGGNSLNRNIVVAFTFGDRQDRDIRDDVNNAPPELRQLLGMAKGRYLLFTNKADANKRAQAQACFELMERINNTTSCLVCQCCPGLCPLHNRP